MSSACSRSLPSDGMRRYLPTPGCRAGSRLAERRQHLAGEPLHLSELVERAEAADEVVDARGRERPEPVDDLLR